MLEACLKHKALSLFVFLPSSQKPKREMEEKHVLREVKNSFITNPNASAFSVFSHIRHLVLQMRLCETYNSRISLDSGVESEEEEEESEKDNSKKMPVVVGIGVKGVFTIIQEIWRTHPELCLRALREFLNILQGQRPAGLKNEPKETTGRKVQCSMVCLRWLIWSTGSCSCASMYVLCL